MYRQLKDYFEALVIKKLDKIEKRCIDYIRDFKSLIMGECAVYTRLKCEETAKMLTHEHRSIIKQFLSYRDLMENKLTKTV